MGFGTADAADVRGGRPSRPGCRAVLVAKYCPTGENKNRVLKKRKEKSEKMRMVLKIVGGMDEGGSCVGGGAGGQTHLTFR